jgi:hypothetical protein
MARPPAYYLYSDGRKTMHASNSLQDLVKVAKLHAGLVGRRYDVKDASGNVVWEGDNCDKIE